MPDDLETDRGHGKGKQTIHKTGIAVRVIFWTSHLKIQ